MSWQSWNQAHDIPWGVVCHSDLIVDVGKVGQKSLMFLSNFINMVGGKDDHSVLTWKKYM